MSALLLAKSALRVANRTGLGKSRAMADLNRARSQHKAMSIDLEITIAGIPAGVHITHYSPPERQTLDDPGCSAEYEFVITDRKGYQADWLAAKESGDAIYHKVVQAANL